MIHGNELCGRIRTFERTGEDLCWRNRKKEMGCRITSKQRCSVAPAERQTANRPFQHAAVGQQSNNVRGDQEYMNAYNKRPTRARNLATVRMHGTDHAEQQTTNTQGPQQWAEESGTATRTSGDQAVKGNKPGWPVKQSARRLTRENTITRKPEESIPLAV